MKKLQKDQILGIICILVAAFFTWQSLILPKPMFEGDPGLAMFPLIGCALIALCSIILIVKPEKSDNEPFLTGNQWVSGLILFGIYLLDCVLLYLIGFFITNFIILFIITVMFSRISSDDKRWRSCIIKGLIYSVVGGCLLYVIYIIALDAQMPRGIIWKLLK